MRASVRKSYGNEINRYQKQTDPIVRGYFPKHKTHKERVISTVNRTLCTILSLLIMTSLISYYCVTSSEHKLNVIRKHTLALNYENVELQNKLDYLKSYYNVDKKMKQNRKLSKARNVIEIPAVLPHVDLNLTKDELDINWSMGY